MLSKLRLAAASRFGFCRVMATLVSTIVPMHEQHGHEQRLEPCRSTSCGRADPRRCSGRRRRRRTVRRSSAPRSFVARFFSAIGSATTEHQQGDGLRHLLRLGGDALLAKFALLLRCGLFGLVAALATGHPRGRIGDRRVQLRPAGEAILGAGRAAISSWPGSSISTVPNAPNATSALIENATERMFDCGTIRATSASPASVTNSAPRTGPAISTAVIIGWESRWPMLAAPPMFRCGVPPSGIVVNGADEAGDDRATARRWRRAGRGRPCSAGGRRRRTGCR